MELFCTQETLLHYATIVSRAVSTRTTLPILSCLLLEAKEEGFFLTANDLELGIQSAAISAEIQTTGSVALEARIFLDIVRRLPGERVYIHVNDTFLTTIQCGSARFQIMGLSPEDFPALPEVRKEDSYQIEQATLKDMIRQTIFSVAQDESKPILTGELFSFDKEALTVVSVDGYRISLRNSPVLGEVHSAEVVVPGKTLQEVLKILSAETTPISLFLTDRHILFELEGATVVSRLLEGDYIKYAQSFTEDYQTKIVVNPAALVQALERVSLVSREQKKTPVLLDIAENKLVLTANADLGNAYEEIPVEQTGDPLKIGFNPRYLIDALRTIEEDMVSMQFTTALSPCILRPLSGDAFRYLVLPLRM